MNKIIQYQFIQKLKTVPFIEKIYLYGSRAKGINDERADIDLAIECPLATDEQWDQILKIIEEADTLLKIDCVRYDRIKNLKFLNAIANDHIVLFDRKN